MAQDGCGDEKMLILSFENATAHTPPTPCPATTHRSFHSPVPLKRKDLPSNVSWVCVFDFHVGASDVYVQRLTFIKKYFCTFLLVDSDTVYFRLKI